MSRFHITTHAIERYIERVAPVTFDEARRRLATSERAVLAAASIGCKSVKLGCGARLALQGAKIITVYPPHERKGPRCNRPNWGRQQ